jgi:long-chain fatty acid transport protein
VQRWIRFFLSLVLCAVATSAHAGGFAVGRYAGELGNVATDHPTALYFNPAGLALGSGWRIYAEGLLAWRTVEYDRPEGAISNVVEGEDQAGTPESAIDANAGKAKLSNILASPFLGVVSDFGIPNLGVGVGAYFPFGGQATWDKDDSFEGDEQYPGAVDGTQRWATIDGELRTLYVTLAGAYRFPGPRLSIGAGVNFTQSNIVTTRARTPQGNDDLVGGGGGVAEGRSLIDTKGFAIAASIGVNWEALPGLWIAASYQSQPGFGNSTQSGTLTNKFGSLEADASDIYLEQELPDIARIGARYRPMPNVELRLSGDFQRWSVFENQCLLRSDSNTSDKCRIDANGDTDDERVIVNIPRAWDNTFGIRAGGSYWFTPELEVNAGLNYDSSAVPDLTMEASLPDANKHIGMAGIRWAALPEQLFVLFSANNVFYFKRTIEPRMDGVLGTIAPSSVPDGAGSYKQNVLYFNLGAEYQF